MNVDIKKSKAIRKASSDLFNAAKTVKDGQAIMRSDEWLKISTPILNELAAALTAPKEAINDGRQRMIIATIDNDFPNVHLDEHRVLKIPQVGDRYRRNVEGVYRDHLIDGTVTKVEMLDDYYEVWLDLTRESQENYWGKNNAKFS